MEIEQIKPRARSQPESVVSRDQHDGSVLKVASHDIAEIDQSGSSGMANHSSLD